MQTSNVKLRDILYNINILTQSLLSKCKIFNSVLISISLSQRCTHAYLHSIYIILLQHPWGRKRYSQLPNFIVEARICKEMNTFIPAEVLTPAAFYDINSIFPYKAGFLIYEYILDVRGRQAVALYGKQHVNQTRYNRLLELGKQPFALGRH